MRRLESIFSKAGAWHVEGWKGAGPGPLVSRSPEGEWAVQIESDDAGVCVGIGRTRDEALAKAVRLLEEMLESLQGPPADEAQ